MHVCFTKKHYVELLTRMKASGYQFIFFNEYGRKHTNEFISILRHDIDLSVEFAYHLAEIEHKHHIKSTYFFMISSPFYNLCEPRLIQIVTEMKQMGHQIGLHYHHSSGDETEVETHIAKEANILSTIINTPIKVFSIHRPSQSLLLKEMNTPLINAYSTKFLKQFKYLSDSNHHWKEGCLSEHVLRHKRLYVLIHPVWWVYNEPASPVEKVAALLNKWGAEQKSTLAESVKGYKNYLLNAQWEE